MFVSLDKMKFLVLLLAIGCVAASSVDVVLDRAAENVVEAFKQGFDEVPFIQGEADDVCTIPDVL